MKIIILLDRRNFGLAMQKSHLMLKGATNKDAATFEIY